MDHSPILRKSLIAIAAWLALAAPALAQEPGGGIYDQVVGAVAPVVDFLDDYAALATQPITATETIWGAQLLSTADTGESPGSAAPPAEYYPDAPEAVRQAGYTLDGLSTASIGSMSALDFARWLGVSVALPFQLARGVQDVTAIIGPMGLFLTWLMLAVLWVGIMYFLSFLMGFIGNLLSLGEKVIAAIGLFKP
jgi:hypothetical protein